MNTNSLMQTLVTRPVMIGKDPETMNVLDVCRSGQELYKTHFRNGKYANCRQKFFLPYDFIVLAGHPCPAGKFYEVEYFLGDNGVVHRALIQVVDPVTDLRTVLANMLTLGLLPKFFNAISAHLKDDIDVVCVGGCHDEDGEPSFYYTNYLPATGNEADKRSITEYSQGHYSACMEYYCGEDLVEFWINTDRIELVPLLFVCGSSNVMDADFEDRRAEDFERLDGLLDEVDEIIGNYAYYMPEVDVQFHTLRHNIAEALARVGHS